MREHLREEVGRVREEVGPRRGAANRHAGGAVLAAHYRELVSA